MAVAMRLVLIEAADIRLAMDRRFINGPATLLISSGGPSLL